jgi:hypothetical protein
MHTVTQVHRQTERWRTVSWLLAGAICLALTQITNAQPVYKVTDADGNITFTDTPRVSGESTVEEHAVTAPNSAKSNVTIRAAVKPVEAEEPIRYDTRIVTPADNATIPMGPGNFSVQAALNPRLAPDETLQLLLDGEPVGTPQRTANWQLTNVYRGEHRLQVVRLTESGAQLDTSAWSTVYVMRPTVNR